MGMLPCRSSKVCILTAALCWRNFAHGNSDRHRSMVVESNAYRALIQIDADRIVHIERASDRDQNLRKVGVDPPVARFVRIGQRRACHLAAESHVIELAADRTKARFDVAQALAVGQLRERHREILIPAGQIFQIATTAVAGYALLKLLVGKELDQLREYGAPRVHPAFVFQIVLTPKRMHHTESTTLVLSLQKFPRTAVKIRCVEGRRSVRCTSLEVQIGNSGSYASLLCKHRLRRNNAEEC